MRILLLRNNVTDINKLNQGIAVVKQWMSGLPLVLDFIQVDTTKQFSSVQTHPSDVSVEGWVVNTSEIFQEGKRLGQADVYLLYYDRTKIFPTPITPVDGGMAMGLPTDYSPEVFAEFFLHELCHYYFGATGKQDITHTYPLTPPLSQLPRKDWYIHLLKDLIPPNMATQTYKYFKDSEVKGLKPEFVVLLDKARGIAGLPFRITSGYRSTSNNELVGGVPDSSHITGLAVDLAVPDSVSGGKMLLALAQVGLTRFGFYQDGHLHVDMDTSKPHPCYWVK